MDVSSRIILKFNSDQRGVIRMSIPRADLNKPAEDIAEFMEAIIDGGAVRNKGVPVSVKGAEFITTERVPIVAPS